MAESVGSIHARLVVDTKEANKNLKDVGMTASQFRRQLNSLETAEEKHDRKLKQLTESARRLGATEEDLLNIERRLEAQFNRTNRAATGGVAGTRAMMLTQGRDVALATQTRMLGMLPMGMGGRLGAGISRLGPYAAAVLPAALSMGGAYAGANFAVESGMGSSQQLMGMADRARMTGMDAGTLRTFQTMGQQQGIERGATTGMLEGLTRRLQDARAGVGDVSGFAALGVNPFQGTEAVFRDVQEALGGIRNEAHRIMLFERTIGDRSLMPLLQMEMRTFDERRQMMRERYSPRNIAAARELNANLVEVRENFELIGLFLGSMFIPVLRDVSEVIASITSGRMPRSRPLAASIAYGAGTAAIGLSGVSPGAMAGATMISRGAMTAHPFTPSRPPEPDPEDPGTVTLPPSRTSAVGTPLPGRPRTMARRARRAATRAMPTPIRPDRTGGRVFDPEELTPGEVAVWIQDMQRRGVAPFGRNKPADVFEHRFAEMLMEDQAAKHGEPLRIKRDM